MTDYSAEAIARRLKNVSEARRLGLSLERAGRTLERRSVIAPGSNLERLRETREPRK